MESRIIVILAITFSYFIVMSIIAIAVRKYASNSEGFMTGGTQFPAFLIAALFLSEFIGSSVSIGTAQKGYEIGISAAWNLAAIALGFLLLGLILAKKYRETGINTISGILEKNYGSQTRSATSLLSIFAFSTVSVAIYASGGALISTILGISKPLAIVLVGIFTVFYISIGGMRSVIYTNFFNTVVKYISMILVLFFALNLTKGIHTLQLSLPASMFDWKAIGYGQIFSWIIAGVGSIFATQYIIQAIATTQDNNKARMACYYVSILMVPFGLMAALIGMCSAYLYPNIASINSLPILVSHMPTISAAIVVTGLVGAMLGTISATTISSSTLLLKDFYIPYFNKEQNDQKSINFVRIAVVFFGIFPLLLALFADQVLMIAFLGKGLRATLAILILLCFFAPKFGTGKGAFYGIILSIILTILWYLLGNPYGIDSTYMAFLSPILTMSISQLLKQGQLTNKEFT